MLGVAPAIRVVRGAVGSVFSGSAVTVPLGEGAAAMFPASVGAAGGTTIGALPERPISEGVTMRTGITRRGGLGATGRICCSGGLPLGG